MALATRGVAAVSALGLTVAACSSILGIEDLHDTNRPGTAGQGGSGGTGAGAKGGTGSSTGGSGGHAATGNGGAGGSTGGGSAMGGTTGGGTGGGTGGTSGTGGGTGGKAGGAGKGAGGTQSTGGDGGMAGAAGATSPGGGAVHGKVVDVWMQPVPDVPVAIGDGTQMTDAQGKFTFADAPDSYDASLTVTVAYGTAGYVYRGLTRRDPTLQVFQGLPGHDTTFSITPGTTDWSNTDASWYVSFGSTNGCNIYHPDHYGFESDPDWYGTDSTDWTIHSIFFQHAGGVPTAYTAYFSQTVTSAVNDPRRYYDLDLSDQSLETKTVKGTVVPATNVGRTNSVFMRFPSGGTLPLVYAVATTIDPYEYLVPVIPNGTLTIAAAEQGNYDSFAVAYRGGVAPGATSQDLSVPPIPVASRASDGSFEATIADPDTKAYVAYIHPFGATRDLYVLTATPFKLEDVPVVHGEFTLYAATDTGYWVQTHGKPASVDEMTGPSGFIDDFALLGDRPSGPSHTAGSYAESVDFDFTTP